MVFDHYQCVPDVMLGVFIVVSGVVLNAKLGLLRNGKDFLTTILEDVRVRTSLLFRCS